jgi:hydrogenase/urease accessory protein HupE
VSAALRSLLVLLTIGCLHGVAARADVFNPAYLQLSEHATGTWSAVWRVPARGRARLAMYPQFPESWRHAGDAGQRFLDGYYVETRTFEAVPDAAQRITFSGLQGGVTDVIVRVKYANGAEQVERLAPDSDGFVLTPPAAAGAVAATYFVLGMEHILLGIDHLLFVLALLLIVRGWRQVVATVTAFTVAHSLTLVAAALEWIVVPVPPVEAVIALSIVFVAAEAVHGLRGQAGLTARAPWLVAFTFGLLHGLGFASALSEIGLPAHAIPMALLTFNVGVEAGQLLFVAAMLILSIVLRRLPAALARRGQFATAYAIGALAAYWTIERVAYGVLGV